MAPGRASASDFVPVEPIRIGHARRRPARLNCVRARRIQLRSLRLIIVVKRVERVGKLFVNLLIRVGVRPELRLFLGVFRRVPLVVARIGIPRFVDRAVVLRFERRLRGAPCVFRGSNRRVVRVLNFVERQKERLVLTKVDVLAVKRWERDLRNRGIL